MDNKHTPGPWQVTTRVHQGGKTGDIWISSLTNNSVLDTAAIDCYPLKEADRLLIEATPDLLTIAQTAAELADDAANFISNYARSSEESDDDAMAVAEGLATLAMKAREAITKTIR